MPSDAEIICEWMGWARNTFQRTPKSGHLGLCHEVEARLTKEQRLAYWLELSGGGPPELGYWRLVHASSEQKIAALASAI